MEYKKKRDENRVQDQKRFIVIVSVLILLLLFGIGLLAYMFISASHYAFIQTPTISMGATNGAVGILIQQTQVAGTEQFMMTSTARP